MMTAAIRPLLPELIEIGIDVLNPIQWRCAGMGGRSWRGISESQWCFTAAWTTSRPCPLAHRTDVKREVAENIRIFRKGKGYVVAPCHNLQPNTPTANILALYDAVHEYAA